MLGELRFCSAVPYLTTIQASSSSTRFRHALTVDQLVCVSFSTLFETDRACQALRSVQYSVVKKSKQIEVTQY